MKKYVVYICRICSDGDIFGFPFTYPFSDEASGRHDSEIRDKFRQVSDDMDVRNCSSTLTEITVKSVSDAGGTHENELKSKSCKRKKVVWPRENLRFGTGTISEKYSS